MKFLSISEMKFCCNRVMPLLSPCFRAIAAETMNCNKHHVPTETELSPVWPFMKMFVVRWSEPKMDSAWVWLRGVRGFSDLTQGLNTKPHPGREETVIASHNLCKVLTRCSLMY